LSCSFPQVAVSSRVSRTAHCPGVQPEGTRGVQRGGGPVPRRRRALRA